MKLVTFREATSGHDRVGVLTASELQVVDLSQHFPDMLSLIDAGEPGLSAARHAQRTASPAIAIDHVQLRAPLPQPRQMRDAMTFELHYKQSMKYMARLRAGQVLGRLASSAGVLRLPQVWYEQPTYYKCNRFAVVGPEADVIWPRGAELLDYE